MIANPEFLNQPLDFWANVKLIGQEVGYTDRATKKVKAPDILEIEQVFKKLELDFSKIHHSGSITAFGQRLLDYFEFRAETLNKFIEPNLMDKDEAEKLFLEMKSQLEPKSPIPMNKQKGEMKAPAFFTGMINMLIEANLGGQPCNFDPRSLTLFTQQGFPVRILSRRVDGAFPSAQNPIAIWEIKEYYYTTTFGSRVADGVYESLLDGYELAESRTFLKQKISHYLMIDSHLTWWEMGKSYLCRICDMLHQGLVTEAIFGKEILERIPKIVQDWKSELIERSK